MKILNKIILFQRKVAYGLCVFSLGMVVSSFFKSNDSLKEDLNYSFQVIKQQDAYNNILEKVIEENYNHVKRMQLIAGVDTIKDVFTYKMKILNPIDQKTLLHYDMRKN